MSQGSNRREKSCCRSATTLNILTQNLTVFVIIIRLVSEWIKVIILVGRADRFKAVVTVRLLVRVLRLIRAGTREAAVLAGFLLLLLLKISTWLCQK